MAAVFAAIVATSTATATAPGAFAAEPAGVSGEAYGHYTKVGLFGGPQGAIGPSPWVSLPPTGVDAPLTDSEPQGAAAVYGPATIFGGRWPLNLGTAPASGPVNVSTVGTPGPRGSVTSRASITLHPEPFYVTCDGDPPGTKKCTSPGGFGPVVPNEGDELHATCTADEKGVTGSARFVNATLATSTDSSGEPKDTEPIPEFPPVNYTRTGVITNVSDRWKIVYNEQFVDPDGAITVNALHMYLLGPIAVGEQILGHVRCSRKPVETSPTTGMTAKPPVSGVAAAPPQTTLPKADASSTSPLPFAAGGVAVAALLIGGALVTRRRRSSAAPPDASDAPDPPG